MKKISLFNVAIHTIALLTLSACIAPSTSSKAIPKSPPPAKPWATESQVQDTARLWKSSSSTDDLEWVCTAAWNLKMSKDRVTFLLGKPVRTNSGKDGVGRSVEHWYYYSQVPTRGLGEEIGISFAPNGIAIGSL